MKLERLTHAAGIMGLKPQTCVGGRLMPYRENAIFGASET
jgi:hypothetical protein